jgi:hypothetical protein
VIPAKMPPAGFTSTFGALGWIRLGRSDPLWEYPTVTMAIRRFEKRLQVDKKLANRLKHVLKMFQVKT